MPNLHDVEILATGEHQGRMFTEAYLEMIAENTNALIDANLHIPPAKLGHDDDQLFARVSGLPALGWFSNLRVKASSVIDGAKALVADMTDIPTAIFDAIREKMYRKISSEVYTDFAHPESGAMVGPVLRAVALLGADIPEVKGLKDLLTDVSKFDRITLPPLAVASMSETNLTFHTETPGGVTSAGEGGDGGQKPVSDGEPSAGVQGTETPPQAQGGAMTEEQQKQLDEAAAKVAEAEAKVAESEAKAKAAQEEAAAANAKVAETEQKLAERARAEKLAKIEAFAETHKAVIVPAIRPVFDALCEAVGDANAVIKLSEDKTEMVPSIDLVLKFTEELAKAKIAKFGEFAPGDGDTSKPKGVTMQAMAERAQALVTKAHAEGRVMSYAEAVGLAKAELSGV